MKPRLIVLATVLMVITGCSEWEQMASHFASSAVGLNRKVTLYSSDGKILREWEGRYQVETDGSNARFMDNGKAITISGTWLIEEK